MHIQVTTILYIVLPSCARGTRGLRLRGQCLTIPQHREINERTARGIITTAQEVTRDGS